MVNIYDAARVSVHELVRKDLHITRENNEVCAMPLQQRKGLPLGALLVVLFNRHEEKWDAVELRNRLTVGMIGNDSGNLAGHFATLLAAEHTHTPYIALSQ